MTSFQTPWRFSFVNDEFNIRLEVAVSVNIAVSSKQPRKIFGDSRRLLYCVNHSQLTAEIDKKIFSKTNFTLEQHCLVIEVFEWNLIQKQYYGVVSALDDCLKQKLLNKKLVFGLAFQKLYLKFGNPAL